MISARHLNGKLNRDVLEVIEYLRKNIIEHNQFET